MTTIALYLAPAKESGGLFQYARTVAYVLSKTLPADCRLVAFSPPGTEWEDVCQTYGIPWTEVPAPSFAERAVGRVLRVATRGRVPRRVMSRLTPLGRRLCEVQASLCLYMEYEHYSYELATPSLVAVHDLMYRYEPQFAENRQYADAETLFSRIRRGASGILVDSRMGERQLVESFGPAGARVYVLPFIPPEHVYDPGLLAPDPHADEVLAGVPERFFFYPAQFWEHKNHIGLVDAMMQASRECPDIHLVFVGSPKNHYDAVMSHIAAVGATDRVTVLGFVSDAVKVALYRRARALVLPTFYGPTSLPPLEARALGCAVALSRNEANVEQMGDAALYFDPASQEELTSCLVRLWNDDALHAALVRRGLERAKAWGPQEFGDALWRIIDDVVRQQDSRDRQHAVNGRGSPSTGGTSRTGR